MYLYIIIHVDQIETHLNFEYIMCCLATELISIAKVFIDVTASHHHRQHH